MSEIPQLAELARRKRMLLVTATLQREVIAVRWEEAEASAQWVERGVEMARQARPWLKMLLPLIGIFRWGRKRRPEKEQGQKSFLAQLIGWLRKGLGFWSFVQQFRKG